MAIRFFWRVDLCEPVNCITVLLFYCFTVLLFYCFTVSLFHCFTVSLFLGSLTNKINSATTTNTPIRFAASGA